MTQPAPAASPAVPSWQAVLTGTLLMQIAIMFALQTLPVLWPLLTAETGLSPQSLGYLNAATALGTALYLAAGGPLLARFGAVRMLQGGAVLAGLSTIACVLAWPVTLLVASLLRGVADGPTVPAGSRVLARTAPQHHRALIMSAKQAGAPAGGVLAGLLLPPLALAFGWQAGLIAAGLLILAVALAVQPLRARLDADRDRARAIGPRTLLSPANMMAPLAALRSHPALVPLTILTVSFALIYSCLFTFCVTYLVAGHGYGLAEAGAVFAAMLTGSVLARFLVGWLADRAGTAAPVLLSLLLLAGLAVLAFGLLPGSVPLPVVAALAFLAGASGASFQGPVLAEIARLAPDARMSEAIAGVSLCAYLAFCGGPVLFAAGVSLSGGWTLPMLLMAAQAAAVAIGMRGWLRRTQVAPPPAIA